MLDLARLLIMNGKPSREMIDYLVDKSVNSMVEQTYRTITSMPRASFINPVDVNNDIKAYASFDLSSQSQFIVDVIEDVKKSIWRYQPFLKFNGDFDKIISMIDLKSDTYINFPCSLVLEITSDMKKSYLLNSELSHGLKVNEEFNKKSKT